MDQQAKADYGAAPAQYRETISSYFDSALKDPRSIQYGEIAKPVTGFFQTREPILSGGKVTTTYGWLVNATVNAKNSYGGYIGFKTWSFFFRGEELIKVDPPAPE